MILSLLLAAAALACAPQPIPQTTPAPAANAKLPAHVQFSLDGSNLKVHFDVQSDAKIFGFPKLAPNQYPYMFDVAEVFVPSEAVTA